MSFQKSTQIIIDPKKLKVGDIFAYHRHTIEYVCQVIEIIKEPEQFLYANILLTMQLIDKYVYTSNIKDNVFKINLTFIPSNTFYSIDIDVIEKHLINVLNTLNVFKSKL